MPIAPEHLRPKPPELSPSEIREAQDAFLAEIRRELVITGHLDAPEMKAVLDEARSHIRVTSRLLGPEVTYTWSHGGQVNARKAAEDIAEVAARRATLVAFGPDPVTLLVDRLRALGLSPEDAVAAAANRVRRLSDGQVIALNADGTPLHTGPAASEGREYTPEELLQLRDPNRAVTAATRAIVEEREHPRPSPAALADKVSLVRGSF